VYLACARKGRATLDRECRFGAVGRQVVREKAVEAALALIWQALE
jgi:nicotinamide mononucleotide (NMN) deamidase PncC